MCTVLANIMQVPIILLAALLPPGTTPQSPSQATPPLGPWTRPVTQPIITPNNSTTFRDPISGQLVHWEATSTFNPAAVVRNDQIHLLYRAEDDTGDPGVIGGHVSRLGLAVSDDGVTFQRFPEPVFYPANDSQEAREVPGGTEDPRLVETPWGTYVLTYTQWSRERASYSVGIATSPDLRHWTKYGPAFGEAQYDDLKYKSAGIVTELDSSTGRLVAAEIGGRYWMYWGEVQVGLAFSDDLIHWTPCEDPEAPGEFLVLLQARPGRPDSGFPEVGPPPVLLPEKGGIVVPYNAKNAAEGEDMDPSIQAGTYSMLEAVFSATNTSALLGRTDEPVLEPELPFETSGQYAAGTTFGEGLVLFKGKWWLYYGAADSFVGVATAPL